MIMKTDLKQNYVNIFHQVFKCLPFKSREIKHDEWRGKGFSICKTVYSGDKNKETT